MKNSMLKGAHLPEGKSQDILRYFSEDLTATQIADLTGVSRVTVNNYFRTIRLRIARHCEEKNPSSNYSKTHSVVYLRKKGDDFRNIASHQEQTVYGFYWHNGKVFASSLEKNDEIENVNATTNNGETFEQYKLQNFHAIADFKTWKLFNIQHCDSSEDDIFCFWNDTKNRMLKFRGLHKSMLYLHVKECEFRYNHRNDNINGILQNIMQKHFSIY